MNLEPSLLLDRASRQRDLVPPHRLAQCHLLVLGVGAIGRQVALQLAAMGASPMTLYDDDTVETANLAVQGYWPEDLGQSKAQTTAALCQRIFPQGAITALPQRYRRSARLPQEGELAVFACVDSIATRRLIWESAKSRLAFFTDGRMQGEVLRVLAATDPPADSSYAGTLFQPEEAFQGACTARSTLYAASMAAGLMIAQFAKWLRGLPVEPDVQLNLLAMELTA